MHNKGRLLENRNVASLLEAPELKGQPPLILHLSNSGPVT